MTKFIVDFYPVMPNQWIRIEPIVFGDGRECSTAEPLLAQYEMGIDKGRMTKSGIVPYNNSWFAIIEAETARDALSIFWEKLEKESLQMELDRQERYKKTLKKLKKYEEEEGDKVNET